MLVGEFGIVYKGCLTGQFSDEVVAIRILKGEISAVTLAFKINVDLYLLAGRHL